MAIKKMRCLLKSIFVVYLFLLPQLSHAWWNSDWAYRKTISFDEASLVQTQTLSGDITVLVRLHPANFNFFLDVRDDGADLRFIASDDATPLKFHIESYDPFTGIGIIWVRLPVPTASRNFFYMYYGNGEAVSGSEPNSSYDENQTLVMHFNELAGMPLDNTAFANQATFFSGSLQAAGQIDAGAAFSAGDTLKTATSPSLEIDSLRGSTLSLWLKLTEEVNDQANIIEYGSADTHLALKIKHNRFVGELFHDNQRFTAEGAATLGLNRWYHLAMTVGENTLTLYIDGNAVATSAIPDLKTAAGLIMGATELTPGFKGAIDELKISSISQNPTLFRLEAQGESPEGGLITLGEDEQQRGANQVSEYFDLIGSMFESIRYEGWAIILILAVIGIAAVDVIISKMILLRHTETADNHFLAGFRQQTGVDLITAQGSSDEEASAYGHSGLYRLYRAGIAEYAQLVQESGSAMTLSSEALQSVRSTMEVQLVDEQDKLNSRLVMTTIAVSGGPFLGLLGTVLGVMLTFAAIAKAGDVNVNTIAPGVAAALITTVMGLIVAIPALFGYNYVAGRITRRIAVMEVFLEQFMSKLIRASLNHPPSNTQTSPVAKQVSSSDAEVVYE